LLAMLCTNGFTTPYVITHIDRSGGVANVTYRAFAIRAQGAPNAGTEAQVPADRPSRSAQPDLSDFQRIVDLAWQQRFGFFRGQHRLA
jgi:hypothetical protein